MKKYLPLFLLSLSACGPPKHIEQSVQQLERENSLLRSSQTEQLRKIDDLSATVMVLQDRLETLKVAVEHRPAVEVVEKTTVAKKVKPKVVMSKTSAEPLSETSAFGFGVSGSSLPPLKITNRDLAQMEGPGAKPKPESQEKAAVPTLEKGTENPQAISGYNAALVEFEQDRYPEAIRALAEFVVKYPKHEYADNAVYWMGESYFRLREFDRAAEQFERVVRDYPTGNKVPDALLRAGASYLKLSKPLEAKKMFEKVVQEYPQSVAAQRAKSSLAEIPDTGQSQRRM
jgi:tol-pal system protein YbgF